MASTQASRAVPVAQLTIAAVSVAAGYTAIGTFSAPLVWVMVMSTLDQPVQLSFDATNDNLAVPAGNTTPVFIPIDFKSNLMALGNLTVSVKRIGTPTTGNLYICGFSALIV